MHYKKPISFVLLSFLILLSFIIYPSFAETYTNATVLANNNKVQWNTNPVYIGSKVYVPLKEITNAFQIQSNIDVNSQTAAIKIDENEMNLKLDNSIATLNGKYIQTSGAMKIINNRVMVPTELFGNIGMYITARDNTILIYKPVDGKIIYKVESGDMLWKIAQMFGTSVTSIKSLNNITTDIINVGQQLVVTTMAPLQTNFDAITGSATIKSGPGFNYSDVGYITSGTSVKITGKNGYWYKVSTTKGNGYIYYTVIKPTQDISDTTPQSTYFSSNILVDTSMDSIIYTNYTVVSGDNIWSIALKTGLPEGELASVNGLPADAYLKIGQVLKVPVHQIAVKRTAGSQYGEILDWFSEAQYVFPIGKIGKLTDIQTGLSFNAKRTIGANHSDTETLTANDTQIMKQIFGGSWSWNRRAFTLEVDGRKFAVSVSGMPHAGVDGVPFLQNVDNRSGNYGYGPNFDAISGNQMDGHFDLFFLNCLRHVDNQLDSEHQKMVSIAGGLQ
jgi:LysM repeat protein